MASAPSFRDPFPRALALRNPKAAVLTTAVQGVAGRGHDGLRLDCPGLCLRGAHFRHRGLETPQRRGSSASFCMKRQPRIATRS